MQQSPEYKAIMQLLQQSQELSLFNPCFGYIAKAYATQKTGALHKQMQNTPQQKEILPLLQQLIQELEGQKAQLPQLQNKEELKKQFLEFVYKFFYDADTRERDGEVSKELMMMFNSSFKFFDIINYFEPLKPDQLEKQKYCKAKMVEINKKIKNPELIKPKQPQKEEHDNELEQIAQQQQQKQQQVQQPQQPVQQAQPIEQVKPVQPHQPAQQQNQQNFQQNFQQQNANQNPATLNQQANQQQPNIQQGFNQNPQNQGPISPQFPIPNENVSQFYPPPIQASHIQQVPYYPPQQPAQQSTFTFNHNNPINQQQSAQQGVPQQQIPQQHIPQQQIPQQQIAQQQIPQQQIPQQQIPQIKQNDVAAQQKKLTPLEIANIRNQAKQLLQNSISELDFKKYQSAKRLAEQALQLISQIDQQ
ncbi:hypothetical protein pb186bvf_010566 [Paramecium bursaria]